MSDTNHELPSPVELPAPISGANVSSAEAAPDSGAEQGTHEKMPLQSPDPLGLTQKKPNPQGTSAQNAAVISDDDHAAQAKQLAGASPQIADDADLIEKEWVEKAKEIVAKTRENPYLQNKAINEMKTDYIKKRYNKDITNTNTSS